MKKNAFSRIAKLFDEEGADEIGYDPAHIGSVVVASIAGLGALYWLLWTLLVFEGGIFRKISAAAAVLFTDKTLRDFGYAGSPHQMGEFEGWFGNLCALLICAGLAYAGRRLFENAGKRRRRKR